MAGGLRARGVVFDLDGTLLDSFGAIRASLNHVRRTLGRAELPVPDARRMIGWGLERLIEQAFEAGERDEAKRLYRAHYDATCIAGTRVMPGARAALEGLHARGLKLA